MKLRDRDAIILESILEPARARDPRRRIADVVPPERLEDAGAVCREVIVPRDRGKIAGDRRIIAEMRFDRLGGGRSQERERTGSILATRRVENLDLYAALGADFAKLDEVRPGDVGRRREDPEVQCIDIHGSV
ncbi:hypothetical protein ACWGNZ_19955 (plasmid) [Sphingomonas zeae]